MSSIRKHARFVLIAFGVAIATPVALTLISDTASASGYLVATGRTGIVCNPGGGDDCPDGGSIGGEG